MPKRTVTLKEILPLLAQTDRYEAMTEMVAGRKMFFGLQRKTSRSRKRHHRLMLPKPINLTDLMKEAEKAKQQPQQPEDYEHSDPRAV